MKANLLKLCMASLMLVTFYTSCNKKELANPEQGQVVKLSIGGSSTEPLEFIYKDEVVAATTNIGGISMNVLLSVNGQDAEVKIRKKGSTEILQSKTITNAPYSQFINVYYDGDKLYENAVLLLIKGYAISGELEFLVDGKLLSGGSAQIENRLNILMDKNGTRELTIRKKGETTVLFSKTISASPTQQSLVFLFDGTNIVSNVALAPPSNPQNMMISARFQTIFPLQFKNVDVDLVFYTRVRSAANTVVGTKVIPELRFRLPKDGSFNTLELPPLPSSDLIYNFDIVESGTTLDPYTNGTPLILNGYSIKPNEGRTTSQYVTDPIIFEAGKSKLLVITDQRTLAPTLKAVYVSGGKVTDLSQYFQ